MVVLRYSCLSTASWLLGASGLPWVFPIELMRTATARPEKANGVQVPSLLIRVAVARNLSGGSQWPGPILRLRRRGRTDAPLLSAPAGGNPLNFSG